MFRLTKSFRFEASHRLPNHDGKCARLHGHSWVGKVTVESPHLYQEGAQAGMVVDYGRLKEIVDPIIEKYLDHHHLNDTLGLRNPTSEEIASWLYNYLDNLLRRSDVYTDCTLVSVVIEETCTSACEYLPTKR